jgi:hypothetical protein
MKKSFYLIALVCALFTYTTTMAQTRYIDEVFTHVDVDSNVEYGQNYSVLTGTPVMENLVMDVYTPNSDVETNRPLIIYVPTGSFLPRYINQLPVGDKTDSTTVEMCKRFARQGYVVACINYRKGWNPIGTQDERTETIILAVYRALQDSKTAVRYFRKDHATNGNSFGIDPTKICVGGQGTGGYMSFAYSALNKVSELELTKFFNFTTSSFMVDTATWGDWNGHGGVSALNFENHPGYSNDINVVFNVGGGMGDSTWIEAGEIPIISVHCVADAFTPYSYGIVIVPSTGDFVVEVSGSSDVIRIANEKGNNDIFFNPAITDAYTTVADATNNALDATYGNGGNEGLFSITGLADGNGPWEWWDDASVIAEAALWGADGNACITNGYAANPMYQALGPVAGRARAIAFIDTIHGYITPRLYRVFFGQTGISSDLSLENQISIFPNPATDVVTFVSDGTSQITGIEIYNASGSLIKNNVGLHTKNYQINIKEFPTGIYIVNVLLKEGVVTRKLIVQ